MEPADRERQEIAALAALARDLWDDPCVDAPRDRWVNTEDDASIVAWMFDHDLANTPGGAS